MTKLPAQLEPTEKLVRSWTTNRPTFYGLQLNDFIVSQLFKVETRLADEQLEDLSPDLCRVVAAYHGPKGAKVPLTLSTVSGCVRPAFIALNPWLSPSSLSCYDGGCYLFHARSIPGKKANEIKVRAHTTPFDGLEAAASVARRYGLPIRDNQSSDGSLSMSLKVRDAEHSQLFLNLQHLFEWGYSDVPYLCFSSAYTQVTDEDLKALSRFANLVVHVTVSGWHSREENNLRLQEFERYSEKIPNTRLRVVNRQDWAMLGPVVPDSGARVEEWLLDEIERRGINSRVIRTPFHSVHAFPGGAIGSLGTRFMAGVAYSDAWPRLFSKGAGECCTTGKCKTCPTRCGAEGSASPHNLLLAARAFESMLIFEKTRQEQQNELVSLAAYTARLLARKGAELYGEVGDPKGQERLRKIYEIYEGRVQSLPLSTTQRRRLVNDSHALVMDGLDRHHLWHKPAKKRERGA